LIVVATAVWAFFAWSSRSKWNAYLDALRAEPGIVVVSADRSGGSFAVHGLRDPLARDPRSFIAASGLSPDAVAGNWQLYQALDPPIVEARARQLLHAPDSVRLSFDGARLIATGTASTKWIHESARLAPMIAGVTMYDVGSLVQQRVDDVNQELSKALVLFTRGSTAFEPGAESVLSAQLARLRELDELAQITGQRYSVEVVGHADGDGSTSVNEGLSVSRASLVRAAIERLQLAQLDLAARGAGSREPLTRDASEAGKRTNRRVSIRIAAAR
jgi:OOP family OmpA-OmpF porin